MRSAALLVLCLVWSGCVGEPPPSVDVGAPDDGGGFAACASPQAQPIALPLNAVSAKDAQGLAPGVHQVSAGTFLWVWASYVDTQRQDRVSRLNEVQAFREPDGTYALCTRVELATPTMVDGGRATYAVAARFSTPDAFPMGEWNIVVNWIAGCACEVSPRGNTTARIHTSGDVPETL